MTAYTFDRVQTRNGLAVLEIVRRWAKAGRWTRRYTRRVGRETIQAILGESDLYIYANPNVPGSEAYPHDVGHDGTDHASVGLLQQQVGIWGDVPHCQGLASSVRQWLGALLPIDLSNQNVALDIQRVQRSGITDGSNYHAQRDRAVDFMRQHWRASARPGGRRHQRLLRQAPAPAKH